jgi:hypothetical protein
MRPLDTADDRLRYLTYAMVMVFQLPPGDRVRRSMERELLDHLSIELARKQRGAREWS